MENQLILYNTPKGNDMDLEKDSANKNGKIIIKSDVKNISRSFMEHIQTTDDLNVDVLFDFLLVYFNQPRTPPFPICLVKTESESLFETSLGR